MADLDVLLAARGAGSLYMPTAKTCATRLRTPKNDMTGVDASTAGYKLFSRLRFSTGADGLTNPVLSYAGWKVDTTTNNEVGIGNAYTQRASIEYPCHSGNVFRATKSGSFDLVVANGSTADFEPITLTIPPFADFYVLQYGVPDAGGTMPVSYRTKAVAGDTANPYDQQYTNIDTTTGLGPTYTGSGNFWVNGPVMIKGDSVWDAPRGPSVIVIADSLGDGEGSKFDANGSDIQGNMGWAEMTFAGIPLFNCSVGGALTNYFSDRASAGFARRLALCADIGTHVVVELGRNDLDVGAQHVYATTRANLNAVIAQWSASRKVLAATITPKVTGTYATAAGQTIDNAAANGQAKNSIKRAGLNQYIRGLPIGASGVLDIAAAIEDPDALGKFRSDGGLAHTADGAHPNRRGDAAIASYLRTQAVVQNLLGAR